MDKRTIIAIILVFFVFWLSNELIWKQKTPEEIPPEDQQTIVDYESRVEEEVTIPEIETVEEPVLGDTGLFDAEEIEINEHINLSNEKVALIFTNLGAVIRKVHLKEYYLNDENSIVNLIPEDESLLGIRLHLEDSDLDFSQMVFDWEYNDIGGYPSVTFFQEKDHERIVEKRFVLVDDYTVQFDLAISKLDDTEGYTISFDSGIADTEESLKHKDNDYRMIAQIQGSRESLTLRQIKRLENGESLSGNLDWAAIRSKYFIKTIIPEERIQTSYVEVYERNESPAFNVNVRPGRISSTVDDSYQLYLGPMIYGNLQQFAIGLEETMELGWRPIRPLGTLFRWILTSVNSVVPNWGVTIMIFALILKIVLYPLTHKSFKSMQKMQKMQPYMQEIQRKYKSDPKKMQAELSKLYKEHGTNPMGGCFPLLLQMPVFFALFPVLRYSIDLRQASFVWWITDLSEPDPLMILPIVMGLFMFIQQKLSSQSKAVNTEKMDDKQKAAMQSQKMMMYIMPVFMVIIFRGLPSGLVLYWTTFNVFSIAQQYLIKKQLA